jgi:ATP-binding cassette subfamily B protein RaxB
VCRPRTDSHNEATSHPGVQREAQVGQAIDGMRLTRLVVAHRPQTLALVDRVVELSEGRVLRE